MDDKIRGCPDEIINKSSKIIAMKKYVCTLFLMLTASVTSAQEVFFVGLYTKPDPNKSYYCRDMEIVKQIVSSDAEAQQMVIDFKKEHTKESPIAKIFKTGSVVLYDFIKDNKAFNCKYRVISWQAANTYEEAQLKLEDDRDRIKNEYNGEPKEFYSWTANSKGIRNEISFFISGVEINLKKVDKEKLYSTWIAKIKNPIKDKAAFVVFLVDGIRYTSEGKKPFKLQPGETLNVNLGKAVEVDVLVRLGEKDEIIKESNTNQVKNYIRQKVKENNGKLEIGKMVGFSIRG